MSTQYHHSQCQQALTHIREELTTIGYTLDSELRLRNNSLALAVPDGALETIAAIAASVNSPCILIHETPANTCEATAQAVNAWQDILSHTSDTWQAVPDVMSEQELSGIVQTSLTAVYHTLLGNPNGRNIVMPQTIIGNTVPHPDEYASLMISIAKGERHAMRDLAGMLVARGYIRNKTTLDRGTFVVQGEQLRIAPPGERHEVAVTLHGNTVEQIAIKDNRRSREVRHISLAPVAFPPATYPWKSFIQQYLAIAPHSADIRGARARITYDSAKPDIRIFDRHDNTRRVVLAVSRNRVSGALDTRTDTIVCEHRLGRHFASVYTPSYHIQTQAHLLPETPRTASPVSYERAREMLGVLREGKPAVHTDHGIGIYEGLQTRTINGIEREYLILRYAEGDMMSVPVEYAHKVSPYVGQDHPTIHRLGGTLWKATRKKAKEDAVAFAKELLAISGKRKSATRTPYTIKDSVTRKLDTTFSHDLTPDQKRTLDEVLADLSANIPMDRLIVGDVGFGKTELAIRAARHVTENGKQIAVLAPTTLLVQQHMDTFQDRLPDLKARIHVLSRFVPARDQKATRLAAKDGSASIVIGTHALLSPKTTWHNLGLVIIDEEQRFGVKHKEHFKKIRSHVDVLSLSATPIPRTLSMALSGLRQLSVIGTAPKGRKSVETSIHKIDDSVIKQAVQRELSRNGQMYVVAPKIRNLHAIQEHISALVPNARTAVAHGQLEDTQLASVIHRFDEGAIDVLVCSSIVENGLDMPRANTMMVWHAPHFGLADLYQLRGRVGRRAAQGYAYFLYSQERLTPIQKQRLAALTESVRLGSGWELARRDLEIRGAGNLLGSDQSGTAYSVGVQLYLDMVRDAMDADTQAKPDVTIELPLPAIIPPHYIRNARERTRWYQALTRSKPDTLDTTVASLTQEHGALPPVTRTLVSIIRLQHTAVRHGITRISHKRISPSDEDPYDRIIIHANNPPAALRALAPMGNWSARADALSLDVDDITRTTVEDLIARLAAPAFPAETGSRT